MSGLRFNSHPPHRRGHQRQACHPPRWWSSSWPPQQRLHRRHRQQRHLKLGIMVSVIHGTVDMGECGLQFKHAAPKSWPEPTLNH